MPWLEKGKDRSSDNLLFVHIPRCGGTSLMKGHNLVDKITTDASFMKKIFMSIFFSRYEIFEKVNYPIWTELNAVCLLLFVAGNIWLQYLPNIPQELWYRGMAIAMIAGSSTIFFLFTYVLNAPTISRIRFIRRGFLFLNEYLIFKMMADTEYITGVNIDGYLPHLTARKILDGKYVTEKVFRDVSTFAIVRNPYARMVSVYMYNRFGPLESFPHFVKTWYKYTSKDYRERGALADWDIPNHAIPQFEYTHDTTTTANGKQQQRQLVQSVIKLEDLKHLKKRHTQQQKKHHIEEGGTIVSTADDTTDDTDSSSSSSSSSSTSNDEYTELTSKNRNKDNYQAHNQAAGSASTAALDAAEAALSSAENDDHHNDDTTRNLPEAVHRALVEMPHDNSRKTSKPWYELYDQETLELVYEMYHHDFDVFGYDIDLKQRPDLHAPPRIRWSKNAALSSSSSSSSSKSALFTDDSTNRLTTTTGKSKMSSSSSILDEKSSNDGGEECWYPGYYASKLGTGYYASKLGLIRRRNANNSNVHVNTRVQQQQIKQQQQQLLLSNNHHDDVERSAAADDFFDTHHP